MLSYHSPSSNNCIMNILENVANLLVFQFYRRKTKQFFLQQNDKWGLFLQNSSYLKFFSLLSKQSRGSQHHCSVKVDVFWFPEGNRTFPLSTTPCLYPEVNMTDGTAKQLPNQKQKRYKSKSLKFLALGTILKFLMRMGGDRKARSPSEIERSYTKVF